MLRDERVQVERCPVSDADDALHGRAGEATKMAEEAVVAVLQGSARRTQ
jgi:hypothetical protein